MTGKTLRFQNVIRVAASSAACLAVCSLSGLEAQSIAIAPPTDRGDLTPAGQKLTPTAAPGSAYQLFDPRLVGAAGFHPSGGAAAVLSPDQKTLAVVTAGYNDVNDAAGKLVAGYSMEYVFLYDVSSGEAVQKQVLQLNNGSVGAAFSPSGTSLYIGGGADDNVHTYTLNTDGTWSEAGTPIRLGHTRTNSMLPTDVPPVTAGLAVTPDGSKVVVANLYNDSVTILDPIARTVIAELDLRPGKNDPAQRGKPGGEYPYGIAVKGNETAYVSSLRDREIVVVSLGANAAVTSRIKVRGTPNQMVLNPDQTRLYAAADIQDVVNVVDTSTNTLIGSIPTFGPRSVIKESIRPYKGNSANAVAMPQDGQTLYVTNAGSNSLAVIKLGSNGLGRVAGMVPTPFWPTAIAVSRDGRNLYVANWKSPSGPNPQGKSWPANQYVLKLQAAGLLSLPVPDPASLDSLTRTVAANNGWQTGTNTADARLMRQLRSRIKHVIYIVKENRTYDQILGDLETGNGDPSQTQFGRVVTPNFHRLASDFVDLDNFYTPGDVSGDGWPWSTAARETDYGVKSIANSYAEAPDGNALPGSNSRGYAYETEGTNRDVNVAHPTVAERLATAPYQNPDPDLLPGSADVTAPDGPEGEEGKGYLWDAATAKGLTIRDYGFFCDLTHYSSAAGPYRIPLEREPAAKRLQVAFPTKAALLANFDRYFRSFDTAYPDFWREHEWEREFTRFTRDGKLPQLSFVRFMEDHMGNFGTAIDGVNTPETQQADNDYAVARLIDCVNHSRYKANTLILVCEDDAQDGADHVDAHRSTAYLVGPYVKHRALISDRFSTVNLIRTIEDVLGLRHLNLYTASARPMASCFDLNQKEWTFRATPSVYLVNRTQLPVPRDGSVTQREGIPAHDAPYWAERTKAFDFSEADNLKDPDNFNRIVWEGLKGSVPYPTGRSGVDLRQNRRRRLEQAGIVEPSKSPAVTAGTR
ncbi:MAG TPA: beta-propeller fold lactonase family protein [Chthoniobacterales bacterium]